MKSAAKILIAVAMLVCVIARADELASNANPYASLVERNVFGLVPVPTNPPVDPTPPPPPVKITLTGIMKLFENNYQAIFKTPGMVKPGQPPKEESYVMGVGERQDDIEVKKIDDVAGVVTFENHGVIQELPLEMVKNAPAAPAGVPPPAGVPGVVPTAGAFGGGRFGRAARPPVTKSESAPSTGDVQPATANSGAAGGAAPTAQNANAQAQTPEEQILLQEVQMEMQREQWKKAGNPAAAIIPETQVAKDLKEEESQGQNPQQPTPTTASPPQRRR